MAITPSELSFRYSITAGAQGNTLSQPTPAASLGKWCSQTVWPGASIGDLFPSPLTGPQNAALTANYLCVFIYNSDPTNTYQSPVVYISGQSTGGATPQIGVDPTGASLIGASTPQAVVTPNINTPPAGVVFSAPTNLSAGLPIQSIPPGGVAAIWIARIATNSAPLADDFVQIAVVGDTGP